MKPALYFGRWLALYQGTMVLVAAADMILCLLFGADSFFGNYLAGLPLFFIIMHSIVMMYLTTSYAPLVLGFGATRRQIARGYLLCCVGGALLTTLLSWVVARVTALLFPEVFENLSFFLLYYISGLVRNLLPYLCLGTVYGWLGSLSAQGWRKGLVLAAMMLLSSIVCLVCPLVGYLFGRYGNLTSFWSTFLRVGIGQGVSLLLTLIFLPLTLRNLHKMTV